MHGLPISAWVTLHLWKPKGSYQTKTGSCACTLRRKSPRHASCVLWCASCLPENWDSLSKNRPRNCRWRHYCIIIVFSDSGNTLEWPPYHKFNSYRACPLWTKICSLRHLWMTYVKLAPFYDSWTTFNIYSIPGRNFLELEV